MPKRSVLEGDDDGKGHPWKVQKDETRKDSCNVFYGDGFHEKLRMQTVEVTSVEAVKSKIHAHREKKRLAEAEGGGGGKGKRAKAAADADAAEAKEGGFAADSQTRDRKSVDHMNLDGPQRDNAAARETTERNKAASAKAADEVAELRRDRAQLLRLLGEVGVTAVDLGNGDPEAEAVDLGSLADTLVKMDAGAVSESLLAKLIGVGLRAAEEQMQEEAVGLFPKLDVATVALACFGPVKDRATNKVYALVLASSALEFEILRNAFLARRLSANKSRLPQALRFLRLRRAAHLQNAVRRLAATVQQVTLLLWKR